MKSKISAIILAYNERLHIQRCVENVRRVAQEVFVVDCHSTDGTQEIARACGAVVVEHDWPGNQADQLNWALENLPITGDWVLRLDADEYLTEALIAELQARLDALPGEVAGVSFPRDVVFLGRKLRFGMPPVVLLRLWKRGKATCENRKMDEHMVLTEGAVEVFSGHFVDHNLNNLVWWTQKHLGYAQREKGDIQARAFDQGALVGQAARKRRVKGFYVRLPLFWRAAGYFVYRYFIRLGFLDGKAGFLWAFLQAWWYRTLVDALLYEDSQKTRGE